MPEPIEQPARSFGGLIHLGQTRIFQRLSGRIEAKDDEGVDLALDLMIDTLSRIEAPG